MIKPSFLFKLLNNNSVEFYTGVPDSLLKSFCAYITEHLDTTRHIITHNEGGAIALAAGYHLATGKIPLVYMQNSGLGNAVNPLCSLAAKEVYSIPMILLIGWRGEPGVHDEPQHLKMGAIQNTMLEAMGIPFMRLPPTERGTKQTVERLVKKVKKFSKPYALLVGKKIFEPYIFSQKKKSATMSMREEIIANVTKNLPKNSVVVSTTGKTSRELFEIRNKNKESHASDFLTVGSMGHASAIGLGISLSKKNKEVYCLDGDGAFLMHEGVTSIIGQQKPKNFVHIVINNFAHESVGGQPTASASVDMRKIALASGYKAAYRTKTIAQLVRVLKKAAGNKGPVFIEVLTNVGSRSDLGRPDKTPQENKKAFMNYVQR